MKSLVCVDDVKYKTMIGNIGLCFQGSLWETRGGGDPDKHWGVTFWVEETAGDRHHQTSMSRGDVLVLWESLGDLLDKMVV